MPIDYKKYPKNWEQIRQCVLSRAENKCELCDAKNYQPHWKTGSKVVLTIHHIDYDIENNKPFAQLYRNRDDSIQYDRSWKQFAREWSRPAIISSKINKERA